jgi:thiamine-phosphate pyrophosphorylase
MRGLYAITPDTRDSVRLVALARSAVQGGASILQYRNKLAGAAQRREEARALGAICRAGHATFIVNDDVALALEVDADGVHLGRDDDDATAARARLGKKLIGISCYDSLALAEGAVLRGADYVAFGSVFPSATKPGAVRAPLELFRRARALGVPLVAIGGITLANAAQAIAAGADCVAVIADLFAAGDVIGCARAYADLFTTNAAHSTDG